MTPEKAQKNIGLKNGKLSPCPQDMKNCICSEYNDNFYFPPLSTPHNNPIATIKKFVSALKGYSLVSEEQHYLHFTFKSFILKFVDDIEFRIENGENAKTIHIRSASRLGYWDLGANRKRSQWLIENLRKQLS